MDDNLAEYRQARAEEFEVSRPASGFEMEGLIRNFQLAGIIIIYQLEGLIRNFQKFSQNFWNLSTFSKIYAKNAKNKILYENR